MFVLKLNARELLVLQLAVGNNGVRSEALRIAYSTLSEHERDVKFATLWAKMENAECEPEQSQKE